MKNSKTARIAAIFFSAPLILVTLALTAYYAFFWSHLGLGPKDMAEFNDVQKYFQRFSTAKEKLDLARNAVESDTPNLASNHIQQVQQVYLELKGTIGISGQKGRDFEIALEKLKQAGNAIISMPEGGELLGVLERKMRAFNEYAAQNRWQIMTKTSQRNLDRIRSVGTKKTSMMKPSILGRLGADIVRDVEYMDQVASKAKLKDHERAQIKGRLETLRPEIKLLNELSDTVTLFYSAHAGALEAYTGIGTTLEESFKRKELTIHHHTRWSMISFYGLILLPLVLLFAIPLMTKWMEKVLSGERQNYFLETFKNYVIGNELIDNDSDFSRELKKIRSYIQKRMSFGSIFQDSLPFPSMLLDSNLKVMWANNHFFEALDSLEVKQSDESFTWDYLQTFTNFDSPAPLLQAAQEGLAGIYQIQIRNKAQGMMVPYEMYVSPVQYQGQTRVMIIFYPLSALQETIAQQGRSIIGPVNKVLDAWTTHQFTPEFRGRVAADFEQAGIRPLFEKMCFYEQMQRQQHESLLSQIEENENRMFDLLRAVNEVLESQRIQHDMVKDMGPSFKELKNDIIEYVDLRSKIERLFNEQTARARETVRVAKFMGDSVDKYQRAADELNNGFEGLKSVKSSLHEAKQSLDKYRTRVVQGIEQIIVSSKKYAPELQELLSKLRGEIREIEKNSIELHQLSTSFDVHESKLSMMKAPLESLRHRERPAILSLDEVDSGAYQFGRLMASFDELDQKTVDALKDFYLCMNNIKTTNNDIGRTLDNELGHERVDVTDLVIEEQIANEDQLNA